MMKYFFYLLPLFFTLWAQSQETSASPDSASQYSKDTVGIFGKVDIDASFPGGQMGWKKYLEKNFRVLMVTDAVLGELPKKERKKKHLFFTDTVQFIVCKDGTVCEIKSLTNVPAAFKKETARLIAESNLWQPAMLNGKKVKAYRKQPISLVITSE
jgi:protein TonB